MSFPSLVGVGKRPKNNLNQTWKTTKIQEKTQASQQSMFLEIYTNWRKNWILHRKMIGCGYPFSRAGTFSSEEDSRRFGLRLVCGCWARNDVFRWGGPAKKRICEHCIFHLKMFFCQTQAFLFLKYVHHFYIINFIFLGVPRCSLPFFTQFPTSHLAILDCCLWGQHSIQLGSKWLPGRWKTATCSMVSSYSRLKNTNEIFLIRP